MMSNASSSSRLSSTSSRSAGAASSCRGPSVDTVAAAATSSTSVDDGGSSEEVKNFAILDEGDEKQEQEPPSTDKTLEEEKTDIMSVAKADDQLQSNKRVNSGSSCGSFTSKSAINGHNLSMKLDDSAFFTNASAAVSNSMHISPNPYAQLLFMPPFYSNGVYPPGNRNGMLYPNPYAAAAAAQYNSAMAAARAGLSPGAAASMLSSPGVSAQDAASGFAGGPLGSPGMSPTANPANHVNYFPFSTGLRSLPMALHPQMWEPFLNGLHSPSLFGPPHRMSPLAQPPMSPATALSPLQSPLGTTITPSVHLSPSTHWLPGLAGSPGQYKPGHPSDNNAVAAAAAAYYMMKVMPHQPLMGLEGLQVPSGTPCVTQVAANCNPIPSTSAQLTPGSNNSSSSGSGRGKQSKLEPHIKKPLNAFMLYMKEQRPAVMKEVGLKERQSAEINRILGRKWHELSRDDQQKYYEQAKQEREEHLTKYPGWSARDNYAINKKKKKKRDKAQNNLELKKCRARYGVDNQTKWCKHCRRKKKCLMYRETDGSSSNGNGPGSNAGWSEEGPESVGNPMDDISSEDSPSAGQVTSTSELSEMMVVEGGPGGAGIPMPATNCVLPPSSTSKVQPSPSANTPMYARHGVGSFVLESSPGSHVTSTTCLPTHLLPRSNGGSSMSGIKRELASSATTAVSGVVSISASSNPRDYKTNVGPVVQQQLDHHSTASSNFSASSILDQHLSGILDPDDDEDAESSPGGPGSVGTGDGSSRESSVASRAGTSSMADSPESSAISPTTGASSELNDGESHDEMLSVRVSGKVEEAPAAVRLSANCKTFAHAGNSSCHNVDNNYQIKVDNQPATTPSDNTGNDNNALSLSPVTTRQLAHSVTSLTNNLTNSTLNGGESISDCRTGGLGRSENVSVAASIFELQQLRQQQQQQQQHLHHQQHLHQFLPHQLSAFSAAMTYQQMQLQKQQLQHPQYPLHPVASMATAQGPPNGSKGSEKKKSIDKGASGKGSHHAGVNGLPGSLVKRELQT